MGVRSEDDCNCFKPKKGYVFLGKPDMVPATIVASAYIAFQMMADVASLRIVMVAGFSIDAGTFVYPFTFTLRDLVHKTAGIKAA